MTVSVHTLPPLRITAGFNCAAGSEGPVTGINFPAQISATVSINERPAGVVSTAADGSLYFVVAIPAVTISNSYTIAVTTDLTSTNIVTDMFGVNHDGLACAVAREVDENGNVINPPTVQMPVFAYRQLLPVIHR